jgi:hypothetical protein
LTNVERQRDVKREAANAASPNPLPALLRSAARFARRSGIALL